MRAQIGPVFQHGLVRVLLCLGLYLLTWIILRRIDVVPDSLVADLSRTTELTKREIYSLLRAFLTIHLSMVFAVATCRRWVDRGRIADLGLRFDGVLKKLSTGGVIAGLSVGAVFICSLMLGFIRLDNGARVISWSGFAIYLVFHLLVAFAEGLLMVGYVTKNLATFLNRYHAAAVAAVVFAAAHLLNPNVSPLGILNLFLMGLAMSLYFLRADDLWLPIGAHWLWNVAQGPLLGYSVSGRRSASFLSQVPKGSALFNGGRFGFEGSIIVTFVLSMVILFILLFFSRRSDG